MFIDIKLSKIFSLAIKLIYYCQINFKINCYFSVRLRDILGTQAILGDKVVIAKKFKYLITTLHHDVPLHIKVSTL